MFSINIFLDILACIICRHYLTKFFVGISLYRSVTSSRSITSKFLRSTSTVYMFPDIHVTALSILRELSHCLFVVRGICYCFFVHSKFCVCLFVLMEFCHYLLPGCYIIVYLFPASSVMFIYYQGVLLMFIFCH